VIELLRGIRVLECAVLFNGDQTGRLFGDLGADVIKIESPGVGDYLRDFLGQIAPHVSPAHVFANRNKRSLTLNLRKPEGRELFFELLRTADVFVDGFAGNACEKLGIGYAQQRAVKLDIVYCQCSGFGARGPYAQVPTHGQMMGALGGGTPVERGPDGQVRAVRGVDRLADGTMLAASHSVMTALAALIQRQRTGQGAYIDGSGADAVLATNWFHAIYRWNEARITDRRGMVRGGDIGDSAKYQYYETQDEKFLLFCGIEHKFWDQFCRAVGREDLLAAKDESAPVDFGGQQIELRRELAEIFRARTLAEWMELALRHDIAMGPANSLDDLRDDPHLRAREIVHESTHPAAASFTTVGWAAPVLGQPFDVARPAPALGEHSDALLRELGKSDEEIAALRARGIV
jgi:formyl-CoA transferase